MNKDAPTEPGEAQELPPPRPPLAKRIIRFLIWICLIYLLLLIIVLMYAFFNPYRCCFNTPMKPVIYLYPPATENVKVELEYEPGFEATYPAYDDDIKGWNVTARPDGKLINAADGKEYSYLFWDGKSYDFSMDMSKGFVVKGVDTAAFLQKTLADLGLTPKEYNEFIVYWLPKMQNNPYNQIYFAGHEYTDVARLNITPKPDSILRVFMIYRPLQTPITLEEQKFPNFVRQGFTVVEWGGAEISR